MCLPSQFVSMKSQRPAQSHTEFHTSYLELLNANIAKGQTENNEFPNTVCDQFC